MKKLIIVLITAASLMDAMAEVPSLINYQGKLSGLLLSNRIEFKLKLFSQKTGGELIYQEDIGLLTLNDEGVYSFGFGEKGHSIASFSEILSVQEDGKQIFDYALSKVPVADTLSIDVGNYNWNERTGSSNADDLLVQYNNATKSTKIIFLNGSPKKDTIIRFSYRTKEPSIVSALASSQDCWLELTVRALWQNIWQETATLSPRERLLSVPFALTALKLSEPNRSILTSKYYDSYMGSSPSGGSASIRIGPRGNGPIGIPGQFETKFYAAGSTEITVEVYTQTYSYYRNGIIRTIHKAPDLELELTDYTLRPDYEPSEPTINTIKLNEIHEDRKYAPSNHRYIKRYKGFILNNGFYSLSFKAKPHISEPHHILLNFGFGIIAE